MRGGLANRQCGLRWITSILIVAGQAAHARLEAYVCTPGHQRRRQKLLGHKSAVLTLDKYGHLFPDDLDAVADAFDTAADALRTVGVFKPLVVGTNSP